MPSALAIAVGPKPLRSHFAHPDRIYRSGPAFAGIVAVRLRPGDALHLALFPKIGLELGEYPQHVGEALPRRCAGVDRLFSRLQGDATLPEDVDDVLQVAQRTGKPIDLGHRTSVSPSRRNCSSVASSCLPSVTVRALSQ